ncbi:hypothetical protein SFRURICE_014664 [Spodoptera frugiperda]|nr:hypothetical protein SFRURICE_014664 [Spodoptera frugiperda]
MVPFGLKYSMMKSQRGKDLIVYGGYTYGRKSTNLWICSTHKPSCKAKIQINPASAEIAYVFNEHSHPPRQLIEVNGKFIPYAIVRSVRGREHILVGLYTFRFQDGCIWHCAYKKQNPKCRAKLRLNQNKNITEISNSPTYEIVKSQRGKDLLLVDNYTFTKCVFSPNTWTCSQRRGSSCKARLRLDKLGNIVKINNEHPHPPRQFVKLDNGQYIRYRITASQIYLSQWSNHKGEQILSFSNNHTFSRAAKNNDSIWICSLKRPQCKAKIRLNAYNKVIDICNEHNHAPREYNIKKYKSQQPFFLNTTDKKKLMMYQNYTFSQYSPGYFYCSKKKCGCKASLVFDRKGDVLYPGPAYEVIKSQRGKDLILVDNYTFAKVAKSDVLWVCSLKRPLCRAKLRLDKFGNIEQLYNEHDHLPKQYMKTKSGEYVWVSYEGKLTNK